MRGGDKGLLVPRTQPRVSPRVMVDLRFTDALGKLVNEVSP